MWYRQGGCVGCVYGAVYEFSHCPGCTTPLSKPPWSFLAVAGVKSQDMTCLTLRLGTCLCSESGSDSLSENAIGIAICLLFARVFF